MKLIDGKGRLFGALNVVDLLVAILLIAVVALGAWKIFGATEAITAKKVQITYMVRAEGVDPQIYDEAKKHVPSTLMASGKRLDGEITAVKKSPHMVFVLGQDGQPVWTEDPYHVDLTFTMEAMVTESHDVLTSEVGTQEVRIGKKHFVKSEYIEVEGVVISVERTAQD